MHPTILLLRPTHIPERCRANLVAVGREIHPANSSLVNRPMWDDTPYGSIYEERKSPPMFDMGGLAFERSSLFHERSPADHRTVLVDQNKEVGTRHQQFHIDSACQRMFHYTTACCIHHVQVMGTRIRCVK